ncbi:SDR family oxidoreductase [Nocardia sp. NPDC019395]|uniref:SDR family NAD(P)-dependent oxidoreductase n=1 Tax=Nocardia sp. NPDC019395 TaxID=3154686 RepID=UPI0033C6F723
MTAQDRRQGARAGTTAVVTGGGRGFGKAFGAALAREGAAVVLVDVDAGAVEEAADDIRRSGGSARGFAGDVTDETAMATIMAEAAEIHGGIDVLINNAGLHSDEYSRPIREMGLPKVRRLLEVNVVGVIACTLAAHPYMAGRSGACIVNIASAAAHLGGTAYGTSKLAVAGLTVTFARELGADGIRVNAISPGMIATDTIRAELPDAVKERVKAMQYIDTDGAEADIVDAMLYLTSDRARFITGETLRVTGGMAAGV